MHRPICNKVQLNNNDESNKVNDICIYNRDFPPNINKNNMMINNNNNIKKKNNNFLCAQNKKGDKNIIWIRNKERKSIIKKKKISNDTTKYINNNIKKKSISCTEKASCVIKHNSFINKTKNFGRLIKEYNPLKSSKNITNIPHMRKTKNLNDPFFLNNYYYNKEENNPIIICSDEKERKTKIYSTNHHTNNILNYNDHTLKLICNITENNKAILHSNKSNLQKNNILMPSYMQKKGTHIRETIKNVYPNINGEPSTSVENITNGEHFINGQYDALKNMSLNNYDHQHNNIMNNISNKNKLFVLNNNNNNNNQDVIENMNEYPITSKNIYDSIYIPQINIKNIINSEEINNNNNNINDNNNHNYTNIHNNNNNMNSNPTSSVTSKKNENNNLINTLNAYSNVKVAVRIKPIGESEENIVSIFNKNYVLIEKENEKECYLLSQKKKQSTYVFDSVFDVNATQEEVFFQTAKPLIPHVFKGINCTVFAYGATGSGKTYTMLDDKNQNGIVQLSLLELFTIINEKKCRNIKVLMSFLEVYNETIRDLLGKEKNKTLEVQEDVAEVKVSNLCEIEVNNYEQAMLLINEGVKNRKMSPTRANKVSSRSHAILQIYVYNEILDDNMNTINYKAKLCFVDLAGSERASATSNKGERFKEGSYINQSLLALANCINSLASNRNISKVRVKYRDSKLTHLLKNSLEGNCLVVMIANINPSRTSFQESNNTLKYAFRARNIKLCATVQTNDNKESDIEKILKKNENLQKEYDTLLGKYTNLKEFFFIINVINQLYKKQISCYKLIENISDNMSSMELKQDITMYDQLVKMKSDEYRKKVDSLKDLYQEEKQFLNNLFDTFLEKNLNYVINSKDVNDNNKSLLEEMIFFKHNENKVNENFLVNEKVVDKNNVLNGNVMVDENVVDKNNVLNGNVMVDENDG
ncbi:hypothetical protein PFAG_00507 [Plasmodium falciparum Santa Lucia]|uniref:Kinesin-like protein n=1 Tax=Plasmodium falciparum Santa Lucia TaxID=478859 RepID=W7GCB5_PLAFA|nr:hypothetical protein PFAG_00507 [Plasmodium falciparum Santa Lucia]